jgi:hypothetical protein
MTCDGSQADESKLINVPELWRVAPRGVLS